MNVQIFYGGLHEFGEMIPDNGIMSIVDLAIRDDAKHRSIKVDVKGNEVIEINEYEHFEVVVAYSDDYPSLTENLIESFTNFIMRYDIDNLYLQNPPDIIAKHIRDISSAKCEITYQKYTSLNLQALKEIKAGFSETIIGQNNAQQKILGTLYEVAKGRYKKPCVILFYGNTGIGKTETAKYISEVIKQPLFRKQFSMLHSEEFSSYMFGGKHSQNSLAKELLERESNVVLFDEFDKPHPVFYSAFYQLFDECILVDKNYTVKMQNSIIICTSNFLSEKNIKEQLGDPIYSRFDAVIEFEPLSKESLMIITQKEYKKQFDKLDEEEKELVVESGIYEKIMKVSDKLDNARQIRRIIREAFSSIIINNLL